MDIDIVRAWKDAAYRRSLSAEDQACLPANPAGEIELSDEELCHVYGARPPVMIQEFVVSNDPMCRFTLTPTADCPWNYNVMKEKGTALRGG